MPEFKGPKLPLLQRRPMYDHLYEQIRKFEEETRYKKNIKGKIVHPKLKEAIELEFGAGSADCNVASPHKKYAASQKEYFVLLDECMSHDELSESIPSTFCGLSFPNIPPSKT